jgi:DNA-binding transcriptional ArsR family regulator
MRPTANPQSAFRAPLNTLLGTEANVRVLRVLSASDVPLARSDIAARAGLHVSGMPRILSALEEQGLIESIGQGRSRPVRLRQQHPFRFALAELFRAEAARANQVTDGIRAALNQLGPAPVAAWLEGPVAADADRYTDPILVGVLADGPEGRTWADHLRSAFNNLQRLHDVAIEVHVWWRADILAAGPSTIETLRRVVPLVGPPPLDVLGLSDDATDESAGADPRSHLQHDVTARSYAVAIANRLRTEPSLINDAVRYLERRIPAVSARERLELQEWLDMLTSYSPSRVRSFLTSDSERATRLRQSLPFVHVLREEERARVRAALPDVPRSDA